MARPRGYKIDATDLRLIEQLQKQPRLGYEELGKLVGLTYSPCRRRVRRLFDEGYISIDVTIKNEKLVSKSSYCILVEMKDTSDRAMKFFAQEVGQIKEVDLCFELNGTLDFLVRLQVEGPSGYEHLRKIINDLAIDGSRIVQRTQSWQIASTIKESIVVKYNREIEGAAES